MKRQPLRYRGYYYDAETGFYYLLARYYDPATYRFLSADPAPPSAGNPLSLNAYSYCQNDPVNASDPTGEVMTEFYNHDERSKIGEDNIGEARCVYKGLGGRGNYSKAENDAWKAAQKERRQARDPRSGIVMHGPMTVTWSVQKRKSPGGDGGNSWMIFKKDANGKNLQVWHYAEDGSGRVADGPHWKGGREPEPDVLPDDFPWNQIDFQVMPDSPHYPDRFYGYPVVPGLDGGIGAFPALPEGLPGPILAPGL